MASDFSPDACHTFLLVRFSPRSSAAGPHSSFALAAKLFESAYTGGKRRPALFAGEHCCGDYKQGLPLGGEQVALSVRRDQKHLYDETCSGFTSTTFEGEHIIGQPRRHSISRRPD
jgi:hypothetical protein